MFRHRHIYARRVFRRTLWRWLHRNARGVAIMLALLLILLWMINFLIHSAYLRGLYDAAAVCAMVASLGLAFLLTSGAVYQVAGAWGEDNTREELKTARKNGGIWGTVHNIEVAGVDIDHLVISPAGAFALDSKWHLGDLDRATLERDTTSARKGAMHAKSVLRTVDVARPMDVTPVVVIWGRGQRDLPDEGLEYDGVPVVAGADLVRWLQRCRHGRVGADYAADVLTRVEQFASGRRGKTPLREPRPAGSGLRL